MPHLNMRLRCRGTPHFPLLDDGDDLLLLWNNQ